MIIDSQKTLRVGQVLEGLLDDDTASEARLEAGVAQAPVTATGSGPVLSVALWERMMAAVAFKFDADNDGDVRGKG